MYRGQQSNTKPNWKWKRYCNKFQAVLDTTLDLFLMVPFTFPFLASTPINVHNTYATYATLTAHNYCTRIK